MESSHDERHPPELFASQTAAGNCRRRLDGWRRLHRGPGETGIYAVSAFMAGFSASHVTDNFALMVLFMALSMISLTTGLSALRSVIFRGVSARRD
jgi:hypothetical protein